MIALLMIILNEDYRNDFVGADSSDVADCLAADNGDDCGAGDDCVASLVKMLMNVKMIVMMMRVYNIKITARIKMMMKTMLIKMTVKVC